MTLYLERPFLRAIILQRDDTYLAGVARAGG